MKLHNDSITHDYLVDWAWMFEWFKLGENFLIHAHYERKKFLIILDYDNEKNVHRFSHIFRFGNVMIR